MALWTIAGKAHGQDVLAPPGLEYNQKAAVMLPPDTNQTDMVLSGPSPLSTPPVPTWLDWEPVHVHPHLLYRLTYGNGLQAQPGQQVTTTINELSPGVLFDLTTHWRLDYTPTMRFYSSTNFKNTVDHSVALNGAFSYQSWDFGVAQSYTRTATPTIQTASQTDQEVYLTDLSAIYRINTVMSLQLGLDQNFQFLGQGIPGQQLADSRTWSTMDWLNWELWPGFGVAGGIGGGYTAVPGGTDMTFEQYQARVAWRAGQKLSLSVNGGLEDRQFLAAGISDKFSPIFGANVVYEIFESTTFSLSATRQISAAYFQDQTTVTTGFTGNIRQRLLQKLYMDFGGGYTATQYQATGGGVSTSREDDTSNVTIRLTYPFLKRATASVFYQGSKNTSNVPGFGYSSSQEGFELGYRF